MRSKKTLGWGELALGILLIALGIFSFARPESALAGVTYLYGILALVTGIIDIVFYVKLEQRTGFGPGLSLAGGILSILAGLMLLLSPSAGAWALVVLFPIWFIAHCISRLTRLPLVRLAGRSGYYYFTLVLNILGIVLGFIMIVDPLISLFSLGYVIGMYLLILGIDSLVAALDLLDSRYGGLRHG